jgi:hypothetical protein
LYIRRFPPPQAKKNPDKTAAKMGLRWAIAAHGGSLFPAIDTLPPALAHDAQPRTSDELRAFAQGIGP